MSKAIPIGSELLSARKKLLDSDLQADLDQHGQIQVSNVTLAYYLFIHCCNQLGRGARDYFAQFIGLVATSQEHIVQRRLNYIRSYLSRAIIVKKLDAEDLNAIAAAVVQNIQAPIMRGHLILQFSLLHDIICQPSVWRLRLKLIRKMSSAVNKNSVEQDSLSAENNSECNVI